MATVDDKKVIFSMVGVSKTIQQNQKQVLKNIYLSFFYGAKIGIIGLNGAGKLPDWISSIRATWCGVLATRWAICPRIRHSMRRRRSRRTSWKACSMSTTP